MLAQNAPLKSVYSIPKPLTIPSPTNWNGPPRGSTRTPNCSSASPPTSMAGQGRAWAVTA